MGNGRFSMRRDKDAAVIPMTPPPSMGNEQALEERLCRTLDDNGIRWDRQLRTEAGIADVVTDEAVYEVKLVLDRSSLFKAYGQVTVYAEVLGRKRRVIVGYPVRGLDAVVEAIERQGVEINVVP